MRVCRATGRVASVGAWESSCVRVCGVCGTVCGVRVSVCERV